MQAKQCPYCQKFLTINPRVRKRRKTCGSSSCQRALNRDNCVRWRREHPELSSDYSRVKLWLQKHPGYLQRYRETHPAYVEKNRQAQRLRDRTKTLHLDIRNKIKNQPHEMVDQLWDSSHLDIQNVSELQPSEMTFLFSTFPCLDIQNSLDKKGCPMENGLIEARR